MNSKKLKIGSDHFKNFRMPANLTSHKGAQYFLIRQANMEDNCYDSDLYRLKEGSLSRLTSFGKMSDYYFLEDDIIFPAIRNTKDEEAKKQGRALTVLYRLRDDMGEAEEWKRLEYNARHFEFVDDEHFFFTASSAVKPDSCRVFEEIPFWRNGAGDISKRRQNLFYYDNGKITALCSDSANADIFAVSPDRRVLLFSEYSYDGKAELPNSLKAVRLPELEITEYSICEGARYGAADFISDSEVVITLSRRIEYGLNENEAFYRLNINNGCSELIYDGDPYTRSGSEGSDVKMGNIMNPLIFDKTGFTMITAAENHDALVHISYDASARLLTGNEMIQEAVKDENGYVVIAMSGMDGSELYRLDEAAKLHRLTDLNSMLSKKYHVTEPEEFSFINENNVTIKGFVIPPADFEPGRKYPTILDIHGGPKTMYGPHFFHEMQYWSNEGFAVIFTNPTGSDGRGNAFMDIRGRYGTVDYRDLMQFTDEAVRRFDFIDEKRMGVTGGSYGGFMTNWIIGHTGRFRAAASQRSIASWISFANTSDIGYFFSKDQNTVTPWENASKLWEHSPLKYADRVTTPTLFLHSDEDTRCWMVEGIQMFYALKNFDVPSRLVLFNRENHELSRSGRPENRVRRNEEILNWMKKYLSSAE